MRRLLSASLALFSASLPAIGVASADDGARPAARPASPAPSGNVVLSMSNAGLERWIAAFRPRAMVAGISPETFDAAFRGVSYSGEVIERDRNQSEFTKQIWEYLDSAVSDARVQGGKSAVLRNAALLDEIEARYGVEKEIVVAIWGLESSYGANRGNTPIVEALATLAYDGRRGRFFETQLVAALKILEAGDVSPKGMTGSWAGAMGHTQFIPTSYLAHAVDFRGDGKRDIWSDDPSDALASTAHYLAEYGWTKGQPWGVEVVLPEGFDYGQSGERIRKPASEWAEMGVRAAGTGAIVPDHGPASILLPAGSRGAAFMIFENFHVLERYNTADAYVIAVGHLADRIGGAGPLVAGWPREDRPLRISEKREMQERLTRAGFDTLGIDGIIGPNTIQAIREFQRAQGLIPDGYASQEILRRLK